MSDQPACWRVRLTGLQPKPGRFTTILPASPGWVALMWAMAMLVRLADVVIFPSEALHSVTAALYLGCAPIFAALLAAWALRLRGATLWLASALVSLDLVKTVVAFALDFIAPSPGYFHAFVAVSYFVVVALLIATGFAGVRSVGRRGVAIALVLSAFAGVGALQAMDDAVWRASALVRPLLGRPEPAETETDPAPAIDADVLWSAQPVLVRREVSALRPRVAGTPNVYAMAVAGSGAQALFSREAREALATAAQHFGAASRGGALASNGAADVMRSPLATRDNIAAIAKGIAAKADHRRDLLFLYLASHGSRNAELMSVLPDDQAVQPISATSTAQALREAGVPRRVIVISACFAASWIPALADDDTIIITAAARDRTSFGCDDSRRLTLFGEAFLGSLAVKGVSLHDAFEDAKRKISQEEIREKVTPSLPRAFVGRNMQAVWRGGSRPQTDFPPHPVK